MKPTEPDVRTRPVAPNLLLRTARKVVVAVVGGTVLLIGIVMIVTPGPAVVFIPAGLGILATEFVFAARILKKIKDRARAAAGLDARPKKDGADVRSSSRRDSP